MSSLRAVMFSLICASLAWAGDLGALIARRPGPWTEIKAIDAPSEFKVERLVSTHFGELEGCWNGLKPRPKQPLEAKLKVTIGKELKVFVTLTPSGPLSDCIKEWASKWWLVEPGPEGSTATITLLFHPR